LKLKKLISVITNIKVIRSSKRNRYKTSSSDETEKDNSATSINIEFFFVPVPDSECLYELPYQIQTIFIISV